MLLSADVFLHNAHNERDLPATVLLAHRLELGCVVKGDLVNIVVNNDFLWAKRLDLIKRDELFLILVNSNGRTVGGANRTWKWLSMSPSQRVWNSARSRETLSAGGFNMHATLSQARRRCSLMWSTDVPCTTTSLQRSSS
jgi:hypothetical protein